MFRYTAVVLALSALWGAGDAAVWAAGSPAPSVVTVAILPIQNEADPRFTLCENPSDWSRLRDWMDEVRGKTLRDHDDATPEWVRERLATHLGKRLIQKGYGVFAGEELAAFYSKLADCRREMTYMELQGLIPADGFLLVSFDGWDAREFDSQGILRISYSVYLIDPKQKEKKGIVWSRKSKEVVELEKNDFLFSRRYEDVLAEAAGAVLKGIPPRPARQKDAP